MAKTNKELKLSMPLSEWLTRYTKEELVEMADLMGLGVPDSDSARKDELIEDVEEHIRYSAEDVLGMTSVFELEFLQKLMLPENRYGMVSMNYDALLPLTRVGGIISCPHPLGSDYAIYMVLDEVREYFEPHVAKYIARKKTLGFDRLEQLAMGTLNLFGGMKVRDLIEYVERVADSTDLVLWRNVGTYLLNHMLFSTRRIFHISPDGQQDCFFATPLIKDDTAVKRLFNEVVWDKPNHNYVEYGRETVMEFGKMPFPHIVAPSMERLKDLMVNKAEKPVTELEANQLLTKLWLAKETNENKEWVSLTTNVVLHIDVKDADADDHQVSDALAQSLRDVPEWYLDGKTPDDLTNGINKISAKIEKKSSQPKVETKPSAPHIPILPPTHKIGRNDPCWCGSGKKFKHCHGK